MKIDYLFLHNCAHSVKLLCIVAAHCQRVRPYHSHIVRVLRKPRASKMSVLRAQRRNRVRFCAVNGSVLGSVTRIYTKNPLNINATPAVHLKEVLCIHLFFISVIKRQY